MQITGKATIRVDGRTYQTLDGATLSLGGQTRTTVKGDVVHGYKEEVMEPTLECKVSHTSDISLIAMSAVTAATVEFETDTGVIFILRDAWCAEPASLSDGEIDWKLAAMQADELTP
jgi:hypothetical protein